MTYEEIKKATIEDLTKRLYEIRNEIFEIMKKVDKIATDIKLSRLRG